MSSRVEIVWCMIKNAMAADSTAVPCSFSAMPRATPIAKIIGRLEKTIFPVCARICIIE